MNDPIAELNALVAKTGARGQRAIAALKGYGINDVSPVDRLLELRKVEADMELEAKFAATKPTLASPKPAVPVAAMPIKPTTPALHGRELAAAGFANQFNKTK